MPRVGWLLVSIALYAAALFLPCLEFANASPGSPNQFMDGWQCLVLGIYGIMVVLPFLPWCANPWLLVLWFRAAFRKPTDKPGSWGALVYAVLTLAVVCMAMGYRPILGAFLWLGSIGAGAYAARRTVDPAT